jgi:F-type H+-transporting ATPase subunit b
LVAELSVDIAQKVLREKLDKKGEQMDMINRLLDEINISKS